MASIGVMEGVCERKVMCTMESHIGQPPDKMVSATPNPERWPCLPYLMTTNNPKAQGTNNEDRDFDEYRY